MNRHLKWKLFWFLLFGAFALLPSSAAATESETIISDIRHFSKFFPAPEGTPAEKRLLAALEERIAATGFKPVRRSLAVSGLPHSFSENMSVTCPGRSPRLLTLALPLNGTPGETQALPWSANFAAALSLIEAWRAEEQAFSLKVLFLGAESGTEGRALGSRAYIQRTLQDPDTALIYLNLKNSGPLYLEIASTGGFTPYDLAAAVRDNLVQRNFRLTTSLTDPLLYQLGLQDKESRLTPFLQSEIPALGIRSATPRTAESSPGEIAAMAAMLPALTAALSGVYAEPERYDFDRWDRNYLILPSLTGGITFVQEYVYLAILLLALSLLLLYPLLNSRRARLYGRALAKNSRLLLALALFHFLFLTAGTSLIRAVTALTEFPTYWEEYPLLFFLLKISTTLFLFTLLIRVIIRYPAANHRSFYTASALFFLITGLIVIAFFSLRLTLYPLGALLGGFLFSLVHRRGGKLFFLGLSSLFFLYLTYQILSTPILPACRILLQSTRKGDLFLALFLLPFTLMFFRIDLFHIKGTRRTNRLFINTATVITGMGALTLFLLLLFRPPYNPENPQPAVLNHVIDQETGRGVMTVRSPLPPGPLIRHYGNAEHRWILDKAVSTVEAEEAADFFSLDTEYHRFLSRIHYRVTIHQTQKAEGFTLRLKAEAPILLFDSSFPVGERSPRSGTLTFDIGLHPPAPLVLAFTLPADQRAELEVIGHYSGAADEFRFSKPVTIREYKQEVVTSRVLPAPQEVSRPGDEPG